MGPDHVWLACLNSSRPIKGGASHRTELLLQQTKESGPQRSSWKGECGVLTSRRGQDCILDGLLCFLLGLPLVLGSGSDITAFNRPKCISAHSRFSKALVELIKPTKVSPEPESLLLGSSSSNRSPYEICSKEFTGNKQIQSTAPGYDESWSWLWTVPAASDKWRGCQL